MKTKYISHIASKQEFINGEYIRFELWGIKSGNSFNEYWITGHSLMRLHQALRKYCDIVCNPSYSTSTHILYVSR